MQQVPRAGKHRLVRRARGHHGRGAKIVEHLSSRTAGRLILATLCLVCALPVAYADDVSQALLDELASKALRISVVARVKQDEDKALWNDQIRWVTIPGRAKTVRIEGANILVVASLTPYEHKRGSVLMVIQGQIWITTSPDEPGKYLSTLKSVPVSLGEKLIFYPLGKSTELNDSGIFTLELEIEIQPFEASVN